MVRTKGNGGCHNGRLVSGGIDRWWLRRARATYASARTKVGPPPKFANEHDLWAACCEYFEWMESRPKYESRPFKMRDEVILKEIPHPRPYLLSGLCTYLGIHKTTWYQWREKVKFAKVVGEVEQIMYTQKFEGAVVGLFDAGIIARELGLRDRQEITGAEGGPIRTESKPDLSKLTDEELAVITRALDKTSRKKSKG